MNRLFSGENMDDYDCYEELEPFAPHIAAAPYPIGFKMPNMPMYDGTTDLSNHVGTFNTLMRAHNVDIDVRCVLFPATLTSLKGTQSLPRNIFDRVQITVLSS